MLNCKFIRINKSNDLDYELDNIHVFIHEFKNNRIKELEDKKLTVIIITNNAKSNGKF